MSPTTTGKPKLTRADFLNDEIAYACTARASAYSFAARVAKDGGCNATGVRLLRSMMRANALEAVADARRAKARALRLAA